MKLKVVFRQKADVKNVMVWRKKETERKALQSLEDFRREKWNPNVTIKKKKEKKMVMKPEAIAVCLCYTLLSLCNGLVFLAEECTSQSKSDILVFSG